MVLLAAAWAGKQVGQAAGHIVVAVVALKVLAGSFADAGESSLAGSFSAVQ